MPKFDGTHSKEKKNTSKGLVGLSIGFFFSSLTAIMIIVGLAPNINSYLTEIGFGDIGYNSTYDAVLLISAFTVIPIGYFSDKFKKNQNLVQVGFALLFMGAFFLLFAPETPILLGFTVLILGSEFCLINIYILLCKLYENKGLKLIATLILFEAVTFIVTLIGGLFMGVLFFEQKLYATIIYFAMGSSGFGFLLFYAFRFSFGTRPSNIRKVKNKIINNQEIIDHIQVTNEKIEIEDESLLEIQHIEKDDIVLSFVIILLLHLLYEILYTWNPFEYIDYLNSINDVSSTHGQLYIFGILIASIITFAIISLKKRLSAKKMIGIVFVGVLFTSISILFAELLSLSGSFLFHTINLGFFGRVIIAPLLMGTFFAKLSKSNRGTWVGGFLFFTNLSGFILEKINDLTSPYLNNVGASFISAILCLIVIVYAFKLHQRKFEIKDFF